MARNKYVREWNRQINVPKETFLASFHLVIKPLFRGFRRITRSGFGMDKQWDFEGEISNGLMIINRVPGWSERNPQFSLQGEFNTHDGVLELRIVKQGYAPLAGAVFLFSLIGTVLLWDLITSLLDHSVFPRFINMSLFMALFLSLSYLAWRAYSWFRRRTVEKLYQVFDSIITDIEAVAGRQETHV